MSCNCPTAVPIPYSAVNVIIGYYQSGGTALNVYFKTATGRYDVIQCITDAGTNQIKIANPNLRQDTPYTVTIAEQSDTTQAEKGFTINSVPYNCLYVTFAPEHLPTANYAPTNFEISLP